MSLSAISLIVAIHSVTGDLPLIVRPYQHEFTKADKPPEARFYIWIGGKFGCMGHNISAFPTGSSTSGSMTFPVHFGAGVHKYRIYQGEYANINLKDIFTVADTINGGWWKLKIEIQRGAENDPSRFFPLVETRIHGGFNWTYKNNYFGFGHGPNKKYYIATFELWFRSHPNSNPLLIAGPDMNDKGITDTYLYYQKEVEVADEMNLFVRNWNYVNPSDVVISAYLERNLPFWQDTDFRRGISVCCNGDTCRARDIVPVLCHSYSGNDFCVTLNSTHKTQITDAFGYFWENIRKQEFLRKLNNDTLMKQAWRNYGLTGDQLDRFYFKTMGILQGINMDWKLLENIHKCPGTQCREGTVIWSSNEEFTKRDCPLNCGVFYHCPCPEESHTFRDKTYHHPAWIKWNWWHIQFYNACPFLKAEKAREFLKQYLYYGTNATTTDEIAKTDKVLKAVMILYKEWAEEEEDKRAKARSLGKISQEYMEEL